MPPSEEQSQTLVDIEFISLQILETLLLQPQHQETLKFLLWEAEEQVVHVTEVAEEQVE